MYGAEELEELELSQKIWLGHSRAKDLLFFTPCGYHLHSFTKKKVGTTLIATDQLALENYLSIGDRPYST